MLNNYEQASSIFCDISHTNTDFVSRSFVRTMNVGDRLHTRFDPWQKFAYSLYRNICDQTALQGFLYSLSCTVPISWCVGRNASGYVVGEAYPFVFDNILIHQGNGWNETTNMYVLPHSIYKPINNYNNNHFKSSNRKVICPRTD